MSTTDNGPEAHRGGRAGRFDVVVAVLFLLLGFYVAYESVVAYDAFGAGRVGPGVVPFLIGATLVLTAALILLRLVRDPNLERDLEMPTPTEASRAGALLVLTVVTAVLMPVIGTLVALGLFGLVETTVLERRGWRLGLLTAVTIPALLYVFFELVLGVPLPDGMIGLL